MTTTKVQITSKQAHAPWAEHRRLWFVDCPGCGVRAGVTWAHEIAVAIAGTHVRQWHS